MLTGRENYGGGARFQKRPQLADALRAAAMNRCLNALASYHAQRRHLRRPEPLVTSPPSRVVFLKILTSAYTVFRVPPSPYSLYHPKRTKNTFNYARKGKLPYLKHLEGCAGMLHMFLMRIWLA